MSVNRGKQFEHIFSKAVAEIQEEYSIDILRLYDTRNMKWVTQPADFICYRYPNILYVECKSTQLKSFGVYRQRQYPKLLEKARCKGVAAGMLIWFIKEKRVFWVDILWAHVRTLDRKCETTAISIKTLEERAKMGIGGVIEIEQTTRNVNPKMNLRPFFDQIRKFYSE